MALQNSNHKDKKNVISRRQLCKSGIVIPSSWSMLPPHQSASAARGAAELDFEFYMRDLLGGNKKEGNIQPSVPPMAAPPRTLEGPLIPLLLNSDCTEDCLAVQALVQQIMKLSIADKDKMATANEIQSKVKDLRDKTRRSFFARTPWNEESVSDQYYFDLTSYALWRTAGELLPDYRDRNEFVRNLGKMIFIRLQTDKLISQFSPQKEKILVSSVPAAIEILDVFKSSQFCKGWRIRGDDSSKDDVDFVFDDLGDESLVAGSTVDCLVSIYEPATLGASLQITGERSRFSPDFVGTTLAAMWDFAGVRSSWETFFVDQEYRPNPKDYFPNEQLIQYTLSR